MSTKKFNKLFTGTLILLHLIAALLPARHATVMAQTATCGGQSVRAATEPTITIASADEEVIIPKKEVDSAFYNAWRTHYGKDVYDVEHTVTELLFKHGGVHTYSYLALDFRDKFNEIMKKDTRWYSGGNYDQLVHTALNLAWQTPQLKYAVAGAWREMLDNDSIFSNVDYELARSAERYSMRDKLVELAEDARIEIHDCAQEDPELAEAYDNLYTEKDAEKPLVSVRDDAKTIVAKVPNLQVPQTLKQKIAPDGSIKISLNELKELTANEFKNIHTTIDEIQVALVELDKQQDVIIDYLKDQEARAKKQEETKKKAEATALKLEASKASIAILSTLISQIDPKLGKQVSTVGNSSIKVGAAINDWFKAVAGLKATDKVFSLSTVVMTGNVLGAIMEVVSLFGTTQPTPEQMILAEIGQLRQQVEQLRTEMHDRFDRIDLGLNAIYSTMQERFDKIDIQLGRLNGNILEIQQTLVTLELQLSSIERNNFELLNAIGRRPLLDAIDSGLNYEERTGLQMPYKPDFIDFESKFHTWATTHAYDPGNAGPTQRDYSDAKVYEELTKYPLDVNLNYLNGWLLAHGLPGITDKHLPSSRDWLFASRAYTQLGLEWPEHMKAVGDNRHALVMQVGEELEAAIRRISTVQTAAGPVGNTLLFSTVITYYEDKLAALDSAIQQIEDVYVKDLQKDVIQRAEPFALYGGTNQPLTYLPPELSTLTCGNKPDHGPRTLSSNLKGLIPDFNLYNLAEYLRVGNFTGCLSDEWQELVQYCDDDPERPQAPPTCYWVGMHKAILTIYFDSVPILRQTIDDGYQTMPIYMPDIWTVSEWTLDGGYKGKFEALTTADPPTPEMLAQQAELFSTITAKVEARLAELQRAVHGRVLQEMTQGSLRAATIKVAGARELVKAFTTLGLQSAVNHDEFLHAMLYGNQQLVGDTEIINSYALSMTQPITAVNVLVNPRQVLKTTADKRTTVFGELVGEYLTAITEGSHSEMADFIGNTRFALDLTMRVVQLDLPAEPDPTSPDPGTPDPDNPDPDKPDPDAPDPTNATHLFVPFIER